jgi:hypothetical protein
MTSRDRQTPPPVLSAQGRPAEAERRQRAAAALRENLAKRKRQQRARAADTNQGTDEGTPGPKSKPDVE